MIGFNCIAGITKNYGIGVGNRLPWRKFSKDMNFFRTTTTGGTVIMGRKTFESMRSRPLPDRQNIVITRDPTKYQTEKSDVIFVSSLDEALTRREKEHCYVIGGQQIYQQAIKHPQCQNVLLTHTNMNQPNNDKNDKNDKNQNIFFPRLHQDEWRLVEVIESGEDEVLLWGKEKEKINVKYDIQKYGRIPADILEKREIYPQYFEEAGYLLALKNIIKYGYENNDRTGVGTKYLCGLSFRYDLGNFGYPLFTTKRMFTKGIWLELLWFLQGDTNATNLAEQGVHIWDGNSSKEFLQGRGLDYPEGYIGPAYGWQFRRAGLPYSVEIAQAMGSNGSVGMIENKNDENVKIENDHESLYVDQVSEVIRMLREEPESRRIIINLWNVKDLKKMALPPCLYNYHFMVTDDKKLNLALYQRSGDMGLGVPFNVASASLFVHMLCQLVPELSPGELIHTIGNAHIYNDHIEPLKRQIKRTPGPNGRLLIEDRGQKTIEDFKYEDFKLEGYQHYPGIKMKMAV